MPENGEKWDVEFVCPLSNMSARLELAEVDRICAVCFALDSEVQIAEAQGDLDRSRFRGGARTWFLDTALSGFVEELVQLERTRIGRAVLESMSPGEQIISFQSIDHAGHLSVNVSVQRKILGMRDIRHVCNVQMEVEIDPSRLPECVEEFRRLDSIVRGK